MRYDPVDGVSAAFSPSFMPRVPALGPVVVALLACVATTGAVAQEPGNEDRLKAAFTYQFAQFVDWPEAAWDDLKQVEFCVVASAPLGRELEQFVRGESLRGRPLAIRELGPEDAVDTCQILVLTARSNRAAGELLKQASTRPILTIGDSEGFLDAGGIIRLKVVDRRVRFDVDVAHARRAGLRISSQLLNLARSIRGGPS